MKVLLIIATFVAAATAQYPDAVSNSHYQAPQSYSLPSSQPQAAYGAPTSPQSGNYADSSDSAALTVFRHVYVHVAPDDQASGVVRRIKAPGGGEKHVKIIFVKAPAAAAPDQQVVDIPQAGEQKTLVYVLLKKADQTPDVKISPPAPTKPSKPEVYFIRYKDQKPAAGAEEYGTPAAVAVQTPTPEYGAPSSAYNAPTATRSGGYQ